VRTPHIVVCLAKSARHETIYRQAIKPIQDRLRLKFLSYIDHNPPGGFASAIRRSILYANAVIGITDERKSNVFYELGIAIGLGKPIIPIDSNPESLPAMLGQYTSVKSNSTNEDPEELRGRLEKIIEAAFYGHWADERFKTHIAQLLLRKTTYLNSPSPKECDDGDMLASAIQAYKDKRFQDAIVALERLRSVTTYDAQISFLLADSYFMLAEELSPGGAKRDFYQKMHLVAREGHEKFPEHKDLHKTYGLSQLKLGELDAAESVFQDLVSRHPNYEVGLYNMACVHAQKLAVLPCVERLRHLFLQNHQWRYLARIDPDFSPVWKDEIMQRILFPAAPVHDF